MRTGHKQAQDMFLELGNHHGFQTRRTFTPVFPTDGIWIGRNGVFGELTAAAIEVVVSESPKSIRGSVTTLEIVSPSVGVILLHDDEIRRGLMRNGADETELRRCLTNMCNHIEQIVQRSRQRFEIWTYGQLVRHHSLAHRVRLKAPQQIM